MDLETFAWIEAQRILNADDRTAALKRLYKQVKRGILTAAEGRAILKAIREEEKK